MSKSKSKKSRNPQREIHHRKGWNKFPSFTYPQKQSEIGYVPEGFIKLSKEAVRSLDYYDDNTFTDEDRELYRLVKKYGFLKACRIVFGEQDDHLKEILACTIPIGQYIFDYIKAAGKFDSYFPFCDVSVVIKDNNFAILFDALLSRSSPGGRIYYTKNMPKVIIDNKEFKVGFSRHAVERILDRAMVSMDYFHAHDAYCCLSEDTYFEACFLPEKDGIAQQAVSLFDYCAPGFLSGVVVEKVLNIKDFKEEEYVHRFGYCPVSRFQNFVKAITLLSPGMVGTPEYELLKNADLSREEHEALEISIENSLRYRDLAESNDFKAIKWFHDNGISQILPSNI